MDTLLEAIDVCDVDGFCYGNYTDEEAGTGCTVIVAPEGATGGVDVRGGAPASRETDLLRPENTVDETLPLATPPCAPTLRPASPPCAKHSTTPPPRSSRAM